MRSSSAEPPEPTTSIGGVVAELRPDFPGVSVSKIRFLEAQGLIVPDRNDSGMRVFHPRDIERLRFILTAQRDRFLPLKVIRDHLDGHDRQGEEAAAAPPATLPTPAATATDEVAPPPARRRQVRVSASELREHTGLDAATYGALKSFGLLRVDAAGRHGVDDMEIARQAAALSAYGIEARHLRLFRVAADREIGLAEQVLEPLRRRRARGAPGADPEQVQADIVARSLALHSALVRAGLRASR
ncbi:MAG TPA: MerR family transcriptional regulator [Ornithinimicrobium sp.]|uniref:transcriptional regulator FtsR n=1 Tax=Ornithinimicrobium sp. TaxID=1977084 RepID=UPI002B46C4FE|nr:MerR family transcriptional regulator [Ornithinimicrobium sp.]HKJ11750.1 MerR family transcriptional regulator [Ornithinimicrobium sp.]